MKGPVEKAETKPTTPKKVVAEKTLATKVAPKKVSTVKATMAAKAMATAAAKKKKIADEPKEAGSKNRIIENFIKNNPEISKPEDRDYTKEIYLADESVREDYNLVSETLAELLIEQGHPQKAKKVYEKLIVIHPEKSTYFAARISKLKV